MVGWGPNAFGVQISISDELQLWWAGGPMPWLCHGSGLHIRRAAVGWGNNALALWGLRSSYQTSCNLVSYGYNALTLSGFKSPFIYELQLVTLLSDMPRWLSPPWARLRGFLISSCLHFLELPIIVVLLNLSHASVKVSRLGA